MPARGGDRETELCLQALGQPDDARVGMAHAGLRPLGASGEGACLRLHYPKLRLELELDRLRRFPDEPQLPPRGIEPESLARHGRNRGGQQLPERHDRQLPHQLVRVAADQHHQAAETGRARVLDEREPLLGRLSEHGGRTIALAELRAGDMFGELSMFGGEVRSATAQALEATAAVALLAGDIRRLLAGNPEIGLKMLETMAKRVQSNEPSSHQH